jgi:hypothetical protein
LNSNLRKNIISQ